MAIDFSYQFLLAYGVGAIVIIFFAWGRFNQPSFEQDASHRRVLAAIQPSEMRNRELMSRAYLIYATCLVSIYTLLTFFGRLVFQMAENLTIGGFQFDASNLNFETPEWPLGISLGIVGFMPILKPVGMAEASLRRWAHRAVGVPTMLHENSTRFIREVEEEIKRRRESGTDKAEPPQPQWLSKHVDRDAPIRMAYDNRAQLELLMEWAESEKNTWPSYEVRRRLESLERDLLEEAEDALDDFDEFIQTDYFAEGAKRRKPEAGQDPNDKTAFRRRIQRRWQELKEKLSRTKDELCSVFAFYAEHDQQFSSMRNARFKELLETEFTIEEIQEGPSNWLLLAMIAIFFIFLTAISLDYYSTIGSVSKTELNFMISAAIFTSSYFFIFCLPITLIMGYRFFLRKQGRWHFLTGPLDGQAIRQIGHIGAIAYGTAAAFHALLVVFIAFLLARDQQSFQSLLFKDSLLLYSFALSVIALIPGVLVPLAVDLKRTAKRFVFAKQVLVGLICASLVFGFYMYFQVVWRNFPTNMTDISALLVCTGTQASTGGPCGNVALNARSYEFLNFLMYPLLAFLACTFFIPKMRSTRSISTGGSNDSLLTPSDGVPA
jgi:hypothetical protein